MKRQTKLLYAAAAVIIIIGGALLMQAISKPQSAPIRVACVGDSLTEGSLYPDDLYMMLGGGYDVANFGWHGTTVSLDAPTPYMHEEVFRQALEFKPDIVIIMLGTNDANPDVQKYNAYFIEDYSALIDKFQSLESKPQVWLALPPPIFNNGTGLSTEFFEQHILPGISEVAAKTGLPTIDVYSALLSHPEAFPFDGVHPNDQGSRLIASAVYEALTKE
ncbi:MAG: GDSL-type esterase/lipase family protein [Candidatus Bathyarchaeota archaeon]|nr:GDSL-type esterase/lipase family protein [Candidatus Bathyarchaeota archaeon]